VPDGDISKHLATKELESPHVVAIIRNQELHGVFVVGDTVSTEVSVKSGIMGAVLTLLAMYYIFDLRYPRPYAMLMGVLQQFVMGEPFKSDTSKGFKVFSKKLQAALQKLPTCGPNESSSGCT